MPKKCTPINPFISRPDGFGKSLIISTLESIFKGEKELFKGLYIYDKYDFDPYPVILLDMKDFARIPLEEQISDLNNRLFSIAKEFDVYYALEEHSFYPEPYLHFSNLLIETHRKYGKQVVVLIDNWDYPLLENIENEVFDNRTWTFSNFYSVLKDESDCLRFTLLTGTTKANLLPDFAKLNHLIPLTDLYFK